MAVIATLAVTSGGDDEPALDRVAGDAVGPIDPRDGRITTQYAVGHAPGAIAAGGGSVWIANARDDTASRIDRRRGQVITIDASSTFSSGRSSISPGCARGVEHEDEQGT